MEDGPSRPVPPTQPPEPERTGDPMGKIAAAAPRDLHRPEERVVLRVCEIVIEDSRGFYCEYFLG